MPIQSEGMVPDERVEDDCSLIITAQMKKGEVFM